jgi:uncharacterized protein YrzB (UPF0473 family)
MARFGGNWVEVVLGGAVGAWAVWRAWSLLSVGKYEYSWHGRHYVLTPTREPLWYWLWVALFAGIAGFCLFRAVCALSDGLRVYWMDRRIEERERQSGVPGSHDMEVERSVSVKIVGEDGQEREYHSLEEVPPEIRAELAALEAAATRQKPDELSVTETSKGLTITTRTNVSRDVTVYKFVDEQGVERVYHSLEELPPGIRAAAAEAERKLKDRT